MNKSKQSQSSARVLVLWRAGKFSIFSVCSLWIKLWRKQTHFWIKEKKLRIDLWVIVIAIIFGFVRIGRIAKRKVWEQKRQRIIICKVNTKLEGGDGGEGPPSVNKSSISEGLSHKCAEFTEQAKTSKMADGWKAWGWHSALSFCPRRNRGRFFFWELFQLEVWLATEDKGGGERKLYKPREERELQRCILDKKKNLQLEKIKHIIARAEIERTLTGSGVWEKNWEGKPKIRTWN